MGQHMRPCATGIMKIQRQRARSGLLEHHILQGQDRQNNQDRQHWNRDGKTGCRGRLFGNNRLLQLLVILGVIGTAVLMNRLRICVAVAAMRTVTMVHHRDFHGAAALAHITSAQTKHLRPAQRQKREQEKSGFLESLGHDEQNFTNNA